jgi:uncharacterized protein with beta-barrel porin domain
MTISDEVTVNADAFRSQPDPARVTADLRPRVPGGMLAVLGHAVVLIAALVSTGAFAQTSPGTRAGSGPVSGASTGLFDPALVAQYSPLELIAASATQNVYDFLNPSCQNGETTEASSGNVVCTHDLFLVFGNARVLVETANSLGAPSSQSGSTEFSLNTTVEGLDAALHWSAAEEAASQLSAAKNFNANQQSLVAERLAVLRGPSLASNRLTAAGASGGGGHRRGGGASADDDIGIASRWSAFVNSSYEYGHRADTTFQGGYEDAFGFDGGDASVGADYRISRSLVVGMLGGYTTRSVSFDGASSIVSAHLNTDGGSGTLYGSWEGQNFYVTGSAGAQVLGNRLRRRIIIPSFNPIVPSTNETASSHTTSVIVTVAAEAGYNFNYLAWSLEPYVKASYRHIRVPGFSEQSASGFQFDVQGISSEPVDTVIGSRLQVALTPSFGGVILPYLKAEYHREFNDGAKTESSLYSPLSSLVIPAGSLYNVQNLSFGIPTDRPDHDFFVLAAGSSAVLPHGVQVFAQYQAVLGRRYFFDRSVSAGLRIEF